MANPFKSGMVNTNDTRPVKSASCLASGQRSDTGSQRPTAEGKTKIRCIKCGYGFSLVIENFGKIDCPWCGAVQPKQP
jgi:hypothetical protein